ncbi:MAG: hypothetical protein ACXVBE_05840 [Bdellovibrionota bacterium]
MDTREKDLFSVRDKIRRWKSLSGIFHLLSVSLLVLSLLWTLPRFAEKSVLQVSEELKLRESRRQLLVEVLDKTVRYEKYFGETHGRFTRDLSRLLLPGHYASGSREEIQQSYEISVLETLPNRFIILATGIDSSDRITIDESHRLSANFVLPPPARAYLLEEADRILRLRAQGLEPESGLYSRYWNIERSGDEHPGVFTAFGTRTPVLGEKRELEGQSEPNSIFAAVSEQVKQRMGMATERGLASLARNEGLLPSSPYKENLGVQEVREWLEAGRFAQEIYRREKGEIARRWEDLDLVSDFHFADRMRAVKNIRVHPVDVGADRKTYRLTLEGTAGDLMGEQFVVDQEGVVRQVRYTEALIQQLQETTAILQNTFSFQINPVVGDSTPKTLP